MWSILPSVTVKVEIVKHAWLGTFYLRIFVAFSSQMFYNRKLWGMMKAYHLRFCRLTKSPCKEFKVLISENVWSVFLNLDQIQSTMIQNYNILPVPLPPDFVPSQKVEVNIHEYIYMGRLISWHSLSVMKSCLFLKVFGDGYWRQIGFVWNSWMKERFILIEIL